MARKKLIAGNWKMNGLLADGVDLAKGIAAEVKALGKPQCEFLVCPPFTLLTSVKKALRGAKVALGAQDCHFETKGAHTGDVSPAMLADLGCSYVILGHSERRADHHESNELVNKKAVAAHAAGLKTVICIGETLEQREAGKAIEVCKEQILGIDGGRGPSNRFAEGFGKACRWCRGGSDLVEGQQSRFVHGTSQ